MKITILAPSGEERIPKIDEFYESCVNGRALQYLKEDDLTGKRVILKAHEVEVPDKTDSLYLIGFNKDILGPVVNQVIPLPRPKKVKKWQWEHIQGDIVWRTELLYTEEEMKKYYGHTVQFRKIPKTEVEALT